MWLQDWIQEVSTVGMVSEEFVHLDFLQLAALLLHIVHTFEHEFEEVRCGV